MIINSDDVSFSEFSSASHSLLRRDIDYLCRLFIGPCDFYDGTMESSHKNEFIEIYNVKYHGIGMTNSKIGLYNNVKKMDVMTHVLFLPLLKRKAKMSQDDLPVGP